MITPIFSLSQDQNNVYLVVNAKHANISETLIDIESDNHVKFFSHPYFLRIQLPGKIIENGKECAKYDFDEGKFTITLPKLKQGEHFEDLQMITSLIAVPKLRKKVNLIEEINTEGNDDNDVEEDEDDEEEIEWSFEKVMANDDKSSLGVSKYGFANAKSNVFISMGDEVALAIDCDDVDIKESQVRRVERKKDELTKFDEEYYLACLYEDQESIERLLDFRPYWHSKSQVDQLNDQDIFDLKNVSSRSYILNTYQKKQLLLTLIDILCSYAYEIRINEGEVTSESSWTICKLSATLSWLEDYYESMKDVLVTFIRRSLIFPLYRNYSLSLKVIEDVITILNCGKICVLKCLLDIRRILNNGYESRYILNDLYITDYCIWIQKVKSSTLSKLAQSLVKSCEQISKDDLQLDLNLLEKAAQLTIQEQEQEQEQNYTTTNCKN